MPMEANYIKIKSIKIDQLKGLRNVEITFKEKGLTAILGPNGSGKTSILHVLACLYEPTSDLFTSYRYTDFFIPTHYPDNEQTYNWAGTSFEVRMQHGEREKVLSIKKKPTRWSFQAKSYKSRDKHFFSYIGLRTALPAIEQEKCRTIITFRDILAQSQAHTRRILQYASYILGKDYESYEICNRNDGKSHIGVKASSYRYCSLSMGAGEQRVFYILNEVFRLKQKPSSLLLIDELDILLHQDAIIKLVHTLNTIVNESNHNMQIIFTTHNHKILSENYIEFRHIFQTVSRGTLCLHTANPYVIKSLTGVTPSQIFIYVEDILSKYILRQVCLELNTYGICEIYLCGTIQNVIVAAAGVYYSEGCQGFNQRLFVLDGDKYVDKASRITYLKKLLNGSTANLNEEQEMIADSLYNLIIDDNTQPEKYYAQLIAHIPEDEVPTDYKELYIGIKREMRCSQIDEHGYLKNPIQTIYNNTDDGYLSLVKLLSQSNFWEQITEEVRNRLQEIIQNQGLVHPELGSVNS